MPRIATGTVESGVVVLGDWPMISRCYWRALSDVQQLAGIGSKGGRRGATAGG